MHDATEIVATKRDRRLLHLEVALLALEDVVPHHRDVLVAVGPGVLVIEAYGV
jgi:hypothetical protein